MNYRHIFIRMTQMTGTSRNPLDYSITLSLSMRNDNLNTEVELSAKTLQKRRRMRFLYMVGYRSISRMFQPLNCTEEMYNMKSKLTHM